MGSLILISIVVIFLLLVFNRTHEPVVVIQTKDQKIRIGIEIAKTLEEKMKGLMGREQLKEGNGMLFTYDEPLKPSFWMKNTLIPLDMIFIDTQGVIQFIAQNVQPCKDQNPCPTTTPPVFVQYVLEVPGGYTKKQGIGEGDGVILPE